MSEKSHNDQTLRTYETKLHEYIDNTPQQINEVEHLWIDRALSLIPKTGKILELGSGFGRNAEYIQGRGYNIECTDAVQGFINLLRQKNLKARFLDALKDDFGSENDMVLANGVLVHFTSEETTDVVRKVYDSLKDGGIFAFSVKQGDGSKWTSEKLGAPRFFQYWQSEALKGLMTSHGFEWIAMHDGHTSMRNASWLYIIAGKIVG